MIALHVAQGPNARKIDTDMGMLMLIFKTVLESCGGISDNGMIEAGGSLLSQAQKMLHNGRDGKINGAILAILERNEGN